MTMNWPLIAAGVIIATGAAAIYFAHRRGLLARFDIAGRIDHLADGATPESLTAEERAVERVARGYDAGAPKPSRGLHPPAGMMLTELLDEYRHSPKFLTEHVQEFLDQDDGLEQLRQFCEDARLEGVMDEGEIEDVFLLPFTADQLGRLPPDIRAEVASRRSRPIATTVVPVRVVAPTPDAAPDAAPRRLPPGRPPRAPLAPPSDATATVVRE